jgi:TetR/AcrR family transcriptional regulator, cholesterol catabolism regulator
MKEGHDSRSDTAEHSPLGRLLTTAERLFAERGYTAVRLRHIADELGLSKASLYYHCPGGKQELYRRVIEQSMQRHRMGLTSRMAEAGDAWTEKLAAAADWLLAQPHMDMFRVIQADLRELDEECARHLGRVIFESILLPLAEVFDDAASRRPEPEAEAKPDSRLLAGSFVSIIQGIHMAPNHFGGTAKRGMARQMIAVLAHGLEGNTGNESRTNEGCDDSVEQTGAQARAADSDARRDERRG